MTTRIATGLLWAVAATACLASPAAAHADDSTVLTNLDTTAASGNHATCTSVGKSLARSSKTSDDITILKIAHPRMLAADVAITGTGPDGSTTTVLTDVVRCVGKATIKHRRKPITLFYSLSFGPDYIDMQPDVTAWSLNYADANPGW